MALRRNHGQRNALLFLTVLPITPLVDISLLMVVFFVLASMTAVHRSGARLIPVGSVTSSGRASVNPWFRERFRDLGTPVISGHIRKLVHELKTFLA